jgi:hypothetical protein
MRALIYDRTCVWRGGALSHIWASGSRLYRALGWVDAARGVASWDEALSWLAELPASIERSGSARPRSNAERCGELIERSGSARPRSNAERCGELIDEVQYWGHGKWGCAFVDRDVFDEAALTRAHSLHARLVALRARMAPGALLWFRTCETFGARRGIAFAERLADFLGVGVAGHTFVINFHQSGLHGIAPGARGDWSPEEGLAAGSVDAPERAKQSRPWSPRTVTCLTSSVPPAWFATGS